MSVDLAFMPCQWLIYYFQEFIADCCSLIHCFSLGRLFISDLGPIGLFYCTDQCDISLTAELILEATELVCLASIVHVIHFRLRHKTVNSVHPGAFALLLSILSSLDRNNAVIYASMCISIDENLILILLYLHFLCIRLK